MQCKVWNMEKGMKDCRDLHVTAVLRLLASVQHVRCLEELFTVFWRSHSTSADSLLVHGIKWSCGNGTEEFSVEQLVQQILDTHPTKPAPRTHACLCSGGLGEQPLILEFIFPPGHIVLYLS